MSQQWWLVNYESCHQLPIWWTIFAQDAIPHFFTKIQNLMETMAAHWTRKSYTIFHNGYRYLTIAQSPKRHLSSSLIPPVSITACRLQSDCDRAPRNRLLTENWEPNTEIVLILADFFEPLTKHKSKSHQHEMYQIAYWSENRLQT